jgi:regulator of sigma E protease
MDILHTLLATLVTLGVLVTIHEWGHFYVARRCGVKVLTFSVGFGKPLWRWRDRQGTEYMISAIPLGGYVRMLDEREAPVPDDLKPFAFNRKPVLQRIAVVAAGPLVNLLFAALAYWVMFVAGVSAIKPTIGAVEAGSMAAVAGVEPAGEIVRVDGVETLSWEAVNLRMASRMGESGELTLRVRYPDSTLPREYRLQLADWRFDVEAQSPVSALGIQMWRPEIPPVIGQILPEGEAARAGLLPADHVMAIDGVAVANWIEMVERVRTAPGKPLTLTLRRDERILDVVVTPAVRDVDGDVVGYIGAGVASVSWPEEQQRIIHYSVFESIPKAIAQTWQMITLILDSIGKMLEGVISVKNLSGPITIAKVAGASAESGVEAFVSFLAYLSISLGVLNLLPIPMLDGGHLLYYAIELVRGRPVSERIQNAGLRLGMAILFTLMAVAIVNDVMRL